MLLELLFVAVLAYPGLVWSRLGFAYVNALDFDPEIHHTTGIEQELHKMAIGLLRMLMLCIIV